MFSSTIATLLFGTLFSLPVIFADTPYLGCVLTTAANGAASVSSRQSDSATCVSSCGNSNYPYAFWVGAIVLGNNCYCVSEANYISAANYVVPTGSSTACVAIVQAASYATSSTFSYENCYAPSGLVSGVINTVTGVLGTTVSSPRACFELCAGTSDAYFTPYLLGGNTLSPRYGCSCGDETVVSGSPSYCGLGSFYAYSHPAAAAASSLPRRKRAIERIQAQKRSEMIRERQWDCPTGMSACNVDGVTNSWECVDPTSDIESCGGCTYGEYSASGNASESTGVDCTALPGVLRGSVTCSGSRCEAFACKRGWTLRNGECTKSVTLQL
ncbi:hypothetical protein CNBD1480 [Cryptococcus deneoformans B-3501A]|uniref:Delayed-type hypersensitivity antigen-related n=2 Tax=Cryptococcus deneoformans TaxID=40410 RepID=Q5KHY5_CRYD1|nr:delayed-type hypersensitivity antigen - related [Cryptococcus neoformans var. neoformans JEC21]XP_776100.1 hypothetical protein CNBD1480 [Cryptococcus neoformans var. neoformans B-3501A]AAG01395.1 delayed-type hypersensitivity antigen [Cryptococcus neoformans var. neoformans]AAW43179.1 delayed-type hypersensitivity antigen - related [Cryptococcus neoformans var. neoformans JEC21]EAL21453.1 hypothetical protein CNBD1480 [Cryptococcus neoformans var. neoformans B-3501A]